MARNKTVRVDTVQDDHTNPLTGLPRGHIVKDDMRDGGTTFDKRRRDEEDEDNQY